MGNLRLARPAPRVSQEISSSDCFTAKLFTSLDCEAFSGLWLVERILCMYNYSQGGPNVWVFLTPHGSAENEIKHFWHMEMVDMVITRIWFAGGKSRCLNNFSSSQIWDLDGILVSRPEKTNPPPGQISQFYIPGIIMRSRVPQIGEVIMDA